MFIKHGDGQIMTVIDEEELTEKQKKAVKDISKKIVKQSNKDNTDTSIENKSGR